MPPTRPSLLFPSFALFPLLFHQHPSLYRVFSLCSYHAFAQRTVHTGPPAPAPCLPSPYEAAEMRKSFPTKPTTPSLLRTKWRRRITISTLASCHRRLPFNRVRWKKTGTRLTGAMQAGRGTSVDAGTQPETAATGGDSQVAPSPKQRGQGPRSAPVGLESASLTNTWSEGLTAPGRRALQKLLRYVDKQLHGPTHALGSRQSMQEPVPCIPPSCGVLYHANCTLS